MNDIDENALDPGFADRFGNDRRPHCQLYLISPPTIDIGFADQLKAALEADPVAAFQLRLKGIDEHAIAKLAEPLQKICADLDVSFIINDSIALAKRLGADGVHLGQDDGDARDARLILGKDAQIGVTCHNSRHLAMEAGEHGADYVAFGAFYPSGTKISKYIADTTILGWWTTLFGAPCVAIGGINVTNAAPLIKVGADFIAVSGAIWNAPDGPAAAVKAFKPLLTVPR